MFVFRLLAYSNYGLIIGAGGILAIVFITLGIKIKWFRHSFNLNQTPAGDTGNNVPRNYKAVDASDPEALYGQFRLQTETNNTNNGHSSVVVMNEEQVKEAPVGTKLNTVTTIGTEFDPLASTRDRNRETTAQTLD